MNRACLELIPPFHGGYVTRVNMWAPGPAVTPQNDISTLISPRMYRDFALPYDRQITAAFPYHSFHLHASALHQVDALLALDDLTALELHVEHHTGGPSLEATIGAARRILADKPLLLTCPDVASAEACLAELPWAGLFVRVLVEEPVIPGGVVGVGGDAVRCAPRLGRPGAKGLLICRDAPGVRAAIRRSCPCPLRERIRRGGDGQPPVSMQGEYGQGERTSARAAANRLRHVCDTSP